MRHHSDRQSDCRYASILVAVDLAETCEARVSLAADLAHRFEGRLIGCAAQPIRAPLYFETPQRGIETFLEVEQRRVTDDLERAKISFAHVAGTSKQVEWRQQFTYITGFLVEQARAADLIIVGRPSAEQSAFVDANVDAGDLLMRAGRPILFAPPKMDCLSAKHIVVGWKDTREARRAVVDSLPLLTRATEVTVFSVGREDSGAKDVAAFLACHGIAAISAHCAVAEAEAPHEMLRFAESEAADLIVCGGYGHSRAREWIFGGVTRELLQHAPVSCLMTH
jgi:nucleotide-binding universal stress UspA family protein